MQNRAKLDGRRVHWLIGLSALIACHFFKTTDFAYAEQGIVCIKVTDEQHNPIRNLAITTDGDGGSVLTDVHGKARLPVAMNTKPGQLVTISINSDKWCFRSESDRSFHVPLFENSSANVQTVVLRRTSSTLSKNKRAASQMAIQSALKLKATSSFERGNDLGMTQVFSESARKLAISETSNSHYLDASDIERVTKHFAAKYKDSLNKAATDVLNGEYLSARVVLKRIYDCESTKPDKDKGGLALICALQGQAELGLGQLELGRQKFEESLNYKGNDPIILNNLAICYLQLGQIAEAERVARQSISIEESKPSSNPETVATSLNSLANVLLTKGQFKDAEALLEKAIKLGVPVLGVDHPKVATWQSNLGAIYDHEGRLDDAEIQFRKSLDIRNLRLAPNHPDIANSEINLAGILHEKGQNDAAMSILEKTINRPGQEQLAIAHAMETMGNIYDTRGEYGLAESKKREALKLIGNIQGKRNAVYASFLTSLSKTLLLEYKLGDAEILQKEALGIQRTIVPTDNHPGVINSLKVLGDIDEARGNLLESEEKFENAKRISEIVYGPLHHEMAERFYDLARVDLKLHKIDKAHDEARKCLQIGTQSFGADHPNCAQAMQLLSQILSQMGQISESKKLLLQTKTILEKANLASSPAYALTLHDLGVLYVSEGEIDLAIKLLKESLNISEKSIGSNHPAIAEKVNSLACAYFRAGDFDTSEQLLRRAIECAKIDPSFDKNKASDYRSNLGQVYLNRGKLTLAKQELLESNAALNSLETKDQSKLANNLNGLCRVYLYERDWQNAQTFCQSCVEIQEHLPRQNTIELVTALHNLAFVQMQLKNKKDAHNNLTRALEIIAESDQPNHPIRVDLLTNLSEFYRMNGDIRKSEQYLTEALTIAKSFPKPKQLDIASCYDQFGVLKFQQKKFGEAAEWFRQSLTIKESELGLNSPIVARTQFNLANSYFRNKQFAKSESYFKLCTRPENSIEIGQKEFEAQVGVYASMLQASGRIAEANRLRTKCSSLTPKPTKLLRKGN